MLDFLSTTSPITNLILMILIIVVGLLILRFILRLTAKVLSCGCILVLLAGVVFVIFNYISSV